jgi:hypothetical protein
MNWKVGDLGRFSVEDSKRPRFEVLGLNPNKGIAVWYGGSERPVFVPVDTFKTKCVSHWNMDVVPPLPAWIAPKAVFRIDDPRAANLTQAVVTSGYRKQISQVDVRGHELQVRRIRFDYTSCYDNTSHCLVMVPLRILLGFGTQVLSKFDRLMGADPFGEDGDEIAQLLATLV